jgi:pentatricopeptide repeat protein
MEVHALVVESGFDGDAVLSTGAVNMYGKCGSVVEARSTFEPLCPRDVVAWNTMLAVYAQNGLASHAVNSLEQMLITDRVCPDEITFVCLLTACSHAGCPDTGTYLFAYMSLEHNIPWMRDHYGCMVDLLGRSGRMDEAEALIEQMFSLESGSVAWPSILSACRLHEDFDRGLRASKHCIERDSTGMASLLVLSNLMLACEGG